VGIDEEDGIDVVCGIGGTVGGTIGVIGMLLLISVFDAS
jgi:hypothetical protein